MSRSGYSDDCESAELNLWRCAVNRAIRGQRGQALLLDLANALDEMPNKRLLPGSFVTPEGEFCTLGVLAKKRQVKVDDLGDVDDGCDTKMVGQRFDIAPAMAAEIMYLNDEVVSEYKYVETELCGPVRPHYPDYGRHRRNHHVADEDAPQKRWRYMRNWVASNLKTN